VLQLTTMGREGWPPSALSRTSSSSSVRNCQAACPKVPETSVDAAAVPPATCITRHSIMQTSRFLSGCKRKGPGRKFSARPKTTNNKRMRQAPLDAANPCKATRCHLPASAASDAGFVPPSASAMAPVGSVVKMMQVSNLIYCTCSVSCTSFAESQSRAEMLLMIELWITCRMDGERCSQRRSEGAKTVQLLPTQRDVQGGGFSVRLQRVAAIR